jgi:imidazolonepropionase-like amidohydrolase
MLPRLGALLSLSVLACAPRLVRPSLVRGEAPTCISRVRVFDGTSDTRSPPLDVTFAYGRVEALLPATGAVGPGCRDGEGLTLLPGLIDSHVHLGLLEGRAPWDVMHLPDPQRHLDMLLYAGVTSTLVPEGGDGVADLAHGVAAGKRLGPELFFASRIFTAVDGHPAALYRSGVPWPISAFILSSRVAQLAEGADVAQAVADELPRGPQFLKVVYDALPVGSPHLSRASLDALVREGRKAGVRVVVHVGDASGAVEAAQAGAALLMHVPWQDVLTDAQVAAVAATGVPVVSTARVMEAVELSASERLQLDPLERALCAPGEQEAFAHRPKDFVFRGYDAGFEAGLPGWTRNIGLNLQRLKAAGVRVLAGTDAGLPGVLQGGSLHRELQALVALGFTPAEALRSATSVPAAFLDPARRFGVVAPGAEADLLLVEGDPLADITATEKIVAVWKGGREVLRAQAAPEARRP